MTISFIGTGNVVYHLLPAFYHAGNKVVSVFSRSRDKQQFSRFGVPVIHYTDGIICDSDILIIAVPDDKIYTVSKKIRTKNQHQIVVHTSGAVDWDEIADANINRGFFYPLQTFKKQQFVDLRNVPIVINAESQTILKCLTEIGERVSNDIRILSGVNKSKIHAVAVVVNNFVNYLIGQSQKFLADRKIDSSILHPLIQETIRKAILSDNSLKNQTGPAVRKDNNTIKKHLEILEEHEELREIYRYISENISNYYENNR